MMGRLIQTWQALPAPRRKQAKWAVGLVIIYTVLGFLILPLILRAVAVSQLGKLLGREVAIQKVRINPYVMSGSIRGLLIKDRDGEPFVSWDEAYANFQLSSFFGKPWVFKEVRLVSPYARVQVNKDRTLNCSDLIEKLLAASPDNAEPTKPLVLEVSQLHIAGAKASYSDLTPSTPFRRVIGPLEINVTGFHTDPGNKNSYSFTGTTESIERFSWSGYFFLHPLRSEGEFSVEGISLPQYAPLYQDLVRFELKDGVIDFRAQYRVGLSSSNFIAAVTNAMCSLKSLKVCEKGAADNLAELDALLASGVTADAVQRSAEVARLSLDGARLALRRDGENRFNFVEMSRPAETATNTSGSVMMLLQAATNLFSLFLGSTNLASGVVHELEVTNSAVSWDDLANRRPVHLPVDRIAVSARELSNRSGSNMTAAISLRWNTNGNIRVDATAQVQPAAADVRVILEDLELSPLDPYLEPFVNAFITGSKIGMDGHIQLHTTTNPLPDVTFTGNIRLDDFASLDGVVAEDLIKWKSVRLSGIEAHLAPPQAAVRELAVIEPFARVAIATNHVINLLAALRLDQTNAPVAEAEPQPAPKSSGGISGLEEQFGGVLRETLAAGTNATGGLPLITIQSIVISNAALQFVDQSVQPSAGMSVRRLSGTITGISSEALNRADLHLTGAVGGGPLEVGGKINPLNLNTASEIKVTVRDVDLTPVGGYVGKFAGYALSRGTLNLDLNYQISERKLTAGNLVILDQFTLGGKVDSPDAVKLPVRLAVAVLKDRDGKIEVDVPVEGNLDDPEFRLGKAITHSLVNVLTKIVTSPFAALGSVFGGRGEELSYLEFAPGEAGLTERAQDKLQTLAKGLYERPGLSVELEGCIDPVADRTGLARAKLEQEIRAAKWSALRESEREKIKPEEIEVTPGEFDDYLKRAYANAFSADAVAARTNSPASETRLTVADLVKTSRSTDIEKGAQRLVSRAEVPEMAADEMQQQVFQFIEVTDADFKSLAGRRAESAKQFLIDSASVASERILFAEAGDAVPAKGLRVEVHLR